MSPRGIHGAGRACRQRRLAAVADATGDLTLWGDGRAPRGVVQRRPLRRDGTVDPLSRAGVCVVTGRRCRPPCDAGRARGGPACREPPMVEPDGMHDAGAVHRQRRPAPIPSCPVGLEHHGHAERAAAVERPRTLDRGRRASRIPEDHDLGVATRRARHQRHARWQLPTEPPLPRHTIDLHGRAERAAGVATDRREDVGLAVQRGAPRHGDDITNRRDGRGGIRSPRHVERHDRAGIRHHGGDRRSAAMAGKDTGTADGRHRHEHQRQQGEARQGRHADPSQKRRRSANCQLRGSPTAVT